jgi:hypothetical protein
MSTFFSLLLRRLPLIWALFAGVVIAPLATWGYDVPTQATTAYDGVSGLAFGYDSALTLPAIENVNRAVGTGGIFVNFAKFLAAKTVANPVPSTMARVIPEGIPATTLGRPGAADVFVTAADDIAGMNASQIANRLGIPQSPTGFRVFEFPTPQSGVASPVFRTDPGFIGGGLTSGGAREFVIPNGPIPRGPVRTVP